MAIFLPVLAAALTGDGHLRIGRAIGVALALTAAIYTKQTGIFFALWLFAFVATRDRRGALILIGATAAACGTVLVALCAATSGWFWTWMVDQARHDVKASAWALGVASMVIHAPFLLILPSLLFELRRRAWLRAATTKWVGLLGAGVLAAMLPFVKVGGWYNVLTPVCVLAWPATLMVIGDLARGLGPGAARATWAVCVPLATAGVILLLLKYDPSPFVPSEARFRDAARFADAVRGLDGPVVVTTSPFVPAREKKGDRQPVLQGYFDAVAAGMRVDYADALEKSGARWVITTGRLADTDAFGEVERGFERVRELDVRIETLSDWDHPPPPTLWRHR
jgi:hypothetical protein